MPTQACVWCLPIVYLLAWHRRPSQGSCLVATDSTGCHLLPPYRRSHSPPCTPASCTPSHPHPWLAALPRGHPWPPQPLTLASRTGPQLPAPQDSPALRGRPTPGQARASAKEGPRDDDGWRPLLRAPWINTALRSPALSPLTGRKGGTENTGITLRSPSPSPDGPR